MDSENNTTLAKLSRLDSRVLAQTLTSLAETSDEAEEAIERLLADPQERLQRFADKLDKLNNPKGFVRGQTEAFARKIHRTLDELHSTDVEPKAALDCLSQFFESDEKLIESYDDSYGTIGELIRVAATDLFAEFAKHEPAHAAALLQDLLKRDQYNTRIPLLQKVGQGMPEELLRQLVDFIQKEHDAAEADAPKRHFNTVLLELAKHLKDAELYVSVTDRHRTELSLQDFLELAKIHIHHGRYEQALALTRQAPDKESQSRRELAKLGLRCLQELGREDELEEQAWELFSVMPTRVTFQELVDHLGSDKEDKLKKRAVALIQETEMFSNARALLLLHIGSAELAEEYVLQRAEQVQGEDYFVLSEVADELADAGRIRGATFCYRSLLDSILKRANSRAYRQAAVYFHKLGELAENINDWGEMSPHSDYLGKVRSRHGRKGSFWSKVDELRKT